ncbi:hypothetical protein C0J52_09322 [Blattella germanica]|nr:hypothetical protein C0J52_09322 [Blattella germanica]
MFFKTVDAFLNESDEQGYKLFSKFPYTIKNLDIGLFKSKVYLNMRMGFKPLDAISAFEDARGHKIERQPYIDDIVSEKEIFGTEINHNSESEIFEVPPKPSYEYQPSSKSNVQRQGHHEDSTSHYRESKYATREDFRVDDRVRGGDNCYQNIYPQQDPLYRRSNLIYESPLASSSYDNYDYSSRYSRGYGPQRNRGSSHQWNHPYRRPENSDYSSRYQGSNRGQFNSRGFRGRGLGHSNSFKWEKKPSSNSGGRDDKKSER